MFELWRVLLLAHSSELISSLPKVGAILDVEITVLAWIPKADKAGVKTTLSFGESIGDAVFAAAFGFVEAFVGAIE